MRSDRFNVLRNLGQYKSNSIEERWAWEKTLC